MSSFTTTVTAVIPEENYKPNVRPGGPEKSPDPNWRAWRLRQQRPEIRESFLPTFPNINPQLRQLDLDKIRQYFRPEYTDVHFQPRKLHDLKDHKPVRLQFRPLRDVFREFDAERQRLHPRKIFKEEDDDALPMSWRTEMTQGLFSRVWDFCADTFGRECFGGRVDEQDWTDFILRKLPTEFINCASSVARGDPARHPKPNDPHSYEHLFLAKNERIFLMVGTISKLLQLNVFNSLLFGATEEEAKALNLEDRTTSHTEDGYQRNFSRTNLVRQYLTSGRDLEPQDFWEEVDRVTMGILDLLIPMINFLGTMSPLTAWPTLAEVHQNLHNIVAEAAKLTNGTRVCRAVCWIEFPLTGDLWAINHEHTSDVIYKESQRITSILDSEAFSKRPEVKDWEIRRADAARAARRRWRDQEAEAWIRRWESANPKPADSSRRAGKVQIVLWPSFMAHFPVGQNTASGGGYNTGEERHTLIKAQVVYYSGGNTTLGDQAEDFTLLQHVENHGGLVTRRGTGRFGQLAHGRYESRLLTCLFIALLLFLLLTSSPLSHRLSSPAGVEVMEEHVVESTTSLPITTTTAAGVETSEHPAITEYSMSTSTTKRGFWAPWFGGKELSDMKPADSTIITAAIPAETQPETVLTLPEEGPRTHTVKNIPSSKSTPEVSSKTAADASSKSPSPKSTTTKTTDSEEIEASDDGAKRILPLSSQSSTGKTADKADKADMKSKTSTRSTKPKAISKEDAIEHPMFVTKPDSVKSPASVSSPPSRPEVESAAGGFWGWLGFSNSQSSSDSSTESSGDHTITRPATLPALTAVEGKKTIIAVGKEASSTESIVLSKADGLTVASEVSVTFTSNELLIGEEATLAQDSSSASSTSTSLSSSKEEYLLSDKLGPQTATDGPTTSEPSESSTSSTEAVIQVLGPNQVTITGPPPPAAEGDATEPASPPITSDGWVLEYASIVTHVNRWTNTRIMTYTDGKGQVVTVSEEIPRSTESYSSVAAWHRPHLP